MEEYRRILMNAIDVAREGFWEENTARDPLALVSAYIVGVERDGDGL